MKIPSPGLLLAQRTLLQQQWMWVVPLPSAPDTRPWWQRWFGAPIHQHHHVMVFPSTDPGHELDWVFECACGHTTTNIDEATP